MDGDTPCENSFHPMCAMRYKFLEPPTQYDVKYANHVCPKHTQEKLDKVSKRRRASDAGASLPSKRVTRRQSALPFSSSRGTSNSLLDSHSPSPSTPDDRQGQPDRRATRLPESMDDEVSGSDTSPRQDDSNPPSSGGQEGSKRRIGRRKRRPRRGSAAPGRQEYYNRTIVKVHSGLSRLKEGQTLGDDDENDFGSSINLGSHASDQEDEVIGRGSIAGQDEHVSETGLRSHSRSASTSAAATDKTSPSASNGSRKDKRRLTLRVGSKDAERNSGNSSDETIDEPIVSGLRGKNADHSKTNSESAGQNAQRSSPLPTQSPRQQSRILPAVLEDRASASQSNKSRILPAVTEGRGSTSQNHQLARKRPDPLVSQRNKRSVVHVRAYDRPPNTPPLGSGAGGYSLSAGPRANPSLYALERSERIAAASVTMPEEQVAMIKETHEMMKAQNDMLKSVQDMIKEIVDSPSRQAQQALSTISNLSALVSNGVNGDSVAAYDSTSASALNAGPSAAKDSNGTNNGIGISGTNGVLALPKCTSDSISSGSTAPSAPKPFSGAVELQLPKSAAASPKLPTTNSLASVRPPLGPSILSGITQATGQSPAHAPAASRSLGSDPRLDGDELEEMKENIIYLIKAVNIPQVLNGMISSSGDHTLPSGSGGSRPVSPTSSTSDSKTLPPQLKTMLADLRRFGALSKDNVHEYLKVLVSSMKDVRSKHV
ncbi:hypothetical protein LPJ53_003408 [Coemansia erecta]|uniref:Uncharacterized protein n=1 Tax=Coemansia erecta TaxID=147472 RepID=A0A9W8CSS8_9FUNG|nr:hypothetical protein LPJ53_003408 [Coemansia erecta]